MFIGAFAGIDPTYVELETASYSDGAISPAEADQQVTFNSDGNVYDNADIAQTWLVLLTSSDYEIFVHNDGPGSLFSGTLDSWLSLGSSRAYRITRSALGTSTAALAVQIREVSTGIVRASATITLNATVDI